ncbi:MAG: O-antigen ligase family protein [Candidatus Rokuibacteriota bacterium]
MSPPLVGPTWRHPRAGAVALAGGAVLGLLASVTLFALPGRWTVAALGGLLLVLGALVLPDRRLYGLGLYLGLLLVEWDTGKNLTKDVLDAGQLIDRLGIPPMNIAAIIIRPSDVVLLCLMVPWVLRILTRRDRLALSSVGYLGVAYLGWAAFSALVKARYPLLSVMQLVQEVKSFLFFVYVSNVVTTLGLARNLRVLLMVSLVIEGVVAFAGLKFAAARNPLRFLSDPTRGTIEDLPITIEGVETGYRAVGTFGNFAVTALYLHFLLPLALAHWAASRDRMRQWLYLSLFALGLGTMWITYSRAGLISSVVGLAICLLLCRYRRLMSAGLLLAIVYTGVLGGAIISPKIYNFMTTRPSTLPDRFPIVEKALTMLADDPLLGVGPNNSTAIKRELFADTVADEGSQPIHNHYLVVAVETGLGGFVLFMSAFVLAGVRAFQHSGSSHPDIAAFGVGIVSTYLTIGIHLQGDAMFSYIVYTMLWFYAGLAVALHRIDRGRRGTPDAPPASPGGPARRTPPRLSSASAPASGDGSASVPPLGRAREPGAGRSARSGPG